MPTRSGLPRALGAAIVYVVGEPLHFAMERRRGSTSSGLNRRPSDDRFVTSFLETLLTIAMSRLRVLGIRAGLITSSEGDAELDGLFCLTDPVDLPQRRTPTNAT